MIYNRLGQSNLKVSRIALGTMAFGTRTTESEAHRLLDMAVDGGINLIDTSNDYGGAEFGAVERIIGNWLRKNPSKRDKIVLATKVYAGIPETTDPNAKPGLSAHKIRRSILASLERLQTDHVDLYQLHHYDPHLPNLELCEALQSIRRSGQATYFGTGNYPAWAIANQQAFAQMRGGLGFVSEQSMYSLLCRYAELEVLPAGRALWVGLLAYMPLAGGLLSGNTTAAPGSRTSEVAAEYGLDIEDTARRLTQLKELAAQLDTDVPGLATLWAATTPGVSSVLVGARNQNQLEAAVGIGETQLSLEAWTEVSNAFPMSEGRALRTHAAPQAYAW